ncbi:hypothetical protein OsJ_06815 [Oryza sativa Japonica Group]|uniref:Transposase MuDR plant domain-containing protein n=1 Tax=Oryza sativa subsp. japonica TaxID=39947 RepID=B9F041_ORYSJ|nr:hypothetical protein OsJ_06815 [Oryza sativa Japonica Group]
MQASDEEGNGTPYADNDEEELVEEIGSDGEVRMKSSQHPRYKKKACVPTFEPGMKFNCKKQLKKAITTYALAEKKVINFVRDDAKRVRANCDWGSYSPGYP